jgi:PKD repeat protein
MNRTLLFNALFLVSSILVLADRSAATQLSGSYTIDPSGTASTTVFNDFSSAIIYMTSTNSRPDGGTANSGTVGVSGAVTFNVAAGSTYTLSSPLIIPAVNGASSSNTVTFKKNASGSNPIIYGYKGSGTADGIVIFLGASYITFDGIDLRENSANTTSITQMEWGYALLRTSTPVGSQYNTIQNCNISLNRTNTNSVGIYGDCYTWSSGSVSSVTVTGTSGANSYNKIYSNNISNCFTPIFIRGYSSGSASYVDLGTDVGSKGGNTITAFGYLNKTSPYQNPYTGAYVNGIMLYQQGDTYYINNNTVTLTAADNISVIINGISSVAWSVAVTGSNPVIKNNTISIVSRSNSSAFTAIANNQGTDGSTEDIENNVITGINDTATGAANFIGINIQSTIPNGKYIVNNNEIKNCKIYGTGYFYGISTAGGGSPTSPISFSGNKIHDNIKTNGSSGDMYLIHSSNGKISLTEANNQVYNNTNNTGNLYAIYNVATASTEDIHNNSIYSLSSSTSGYVIGIYSNNTCTSRNIYLDSIANFTSPNGLIYGIDFASGSTTNIYRNKIYFPNGGYAGIYLNKISMSSSAPGIISNNFISIGGSGTGSSFGIYDLGGSYHSVYYNSILITNTYASTAGIFLSAGTSGANIIYENNCVANTGGGYAIDVLNGSGISAMDYNNYYATGAYTGIWTTTNCAKLSNWQTASSADAHSISFNPSYQSNIDLHVKAKALARAGTGISAVTTDIDGKPRHPLSTIGANEINPFRTDIGLTAMTSPVYGGCGDSNMVLTVNAANFGLDTAVNPVVYASVKGPVGSGTYTDTLKMKLAYDSIAIASFSKKFNTSAGGTWTFKIYTSLKNDSDRTNDTISKTITLKSHSPQPAVTGNAICHYGSMKIAAIPVLKTDSIYWYSSPLGGIYLGSGDTLTSPSIATTTTYYAQARMPVNKYFAGPKSNTIGSTSLSSAYAGFKFNVLTHISIDSATVYPAATGAITINLLDSFGKLMNSVSVPVTVSSPGSAMRIPVGILVSQGNGYSISINDSAASGLYYNSTGAVFPYKINNIISILNPLGGTGSSTSYSGLYNIRTSTSNCGSTMTPVTAIIATPSVSLKNDVNSSGKMNAGTLVSPDRVCATGSFIYDIVTSLSNSSYGTSWIISSKSLITPKGTISKDTSTVAPSSKGPGKFYFTPKTINSDSTYILKITVKLLGVLTCDSTITRVIYVNPLPKAKFGFVNACQNIPIAYIDSSTISTGSVSNWTWDFGDGQNAYVANPTHVYATIGKHNTILTVTSNYGCQGSVTRTVEQYPYPKTKFGVVPGCQGYNTSFIDSSTIVTGSINIRKWYFGDGATSAATNPTHIYIKSGYYNVKLVITSSFGCKDSLTKKIRILPRPIASFTYNNSCVGTLMYFANTSFDSTTGTAYLWNFGDNTTSTSAAPAHTYTTNGTFKVKLTVTSKSGCYDTIVQNITPYVKPTPDLYFSNACTGRSVLFADSGKNVSNSLYTWDYGDGSTVYISKNITATHTYSKAGSYKVLLTIQSPSGCTDTESRMVIITDLPKPNFSAGDACLGKATVFSNTSTPATGLTFKWNFGDGSALDISQNPVHAYKNAGSYNAKLIETNLNGCADSITKAVNVIAPPIVGKWTASIHNYTVTFVPQDTTQKLYKWYFGTGDSSSLKKPVYTYPTVVKTYLVRLVETNVTGCSGSRSDSLTLNGTGIETVHYSGSLFNVNIYPNPFEYKTSIAYTLKEKSQVSIAVYDLNGKQLAILKDGFYSSGEYTDEFDASKFGIPAGIYLLKMNINGETWTGRLIGLK